MAIKVASDVHFALLSEAVVVGVSLKSHGGAVISARGLRG